MYVCKQMSCVISYTLLGFKIHVLCTFNSRTATLIVKEKENKFSHFDGHSMYIFKLKSGLSPNQCPQDFN